MSKKPDLLTRDQILARGLKEKIVNIPGLGDVRIIELSARQVAALDKTSEWETYAARLVVASVMDADGQPIFQKEDEKDLAENIGWRLLQLLHDEIQQLNKLGQKSAQEMQQNFTEGPGADLDSD